MRQRSIDRTRSVVRTTTTALLALTLAACGIPELLKPTPPANLPAATDRIGTVSLLGDRFYGTYLGMTATPITTYGNQSFSSNVVGWAVDRNTARAAAEMIRSQGRFDALPLERAAATNGQLEAADREAIWALAKQQGDQVVVVIRPNEREAMFVQAPYGIYERASPFENDQRCVYAMFVAEAFDVATRKSIGAARGASTPCIFGHDEDLPFRAAFEDYTSGQQLAMQQRLDKRVALGLRAALEQLAIIKPPR